MTYIELKLRKFLAARSRGFRIYLAVEIGNKHYCNVHLFLYVVQFVKFYLVVSVRFDWLEALLYTTHQMCSCAVYQMRTFAK